MINCKSINCEITSLGELGSTQLDKCIIDNCTTNLLKCNVDGTFVKTLTLSEKVVICMEIKTLSEDGLIDGLIL